MVWHEVITPEGVPFRYRVAGLGSRILAWLADAGLIAVLAFAGLILASVAELGRRGMLTAVFAVVQFLLLWGYFLLFEWLWHGQTPGKRLVGIRVVTWQGTGMSFFQSTVRNVLRIADSFPLPVPVLYTLGFAVAASNREHRRLGDLAAGTLVVHVERKARPVQAVHEGEGEVDRARQAQVRQRLGQLEREQKQVILELCLRRDQLSVAERARLFRAAAEFFQSRLGLTPEAYQSDERFVLRLASELGASGQRGLEVPVPRTRAKHSPAQSKKGSA
jgi:uncharacterized RDD family membrane protein YckC